MTIADKFVRKLFEHGMENFDRVKKVAENLGGCCLRQVFNPFGPNSPVQFNDTELGDFIKERAVTLFTTSRIVLKDGDPVVAKGHNKPLRELNALMLYTTYDDADFIAGELCEDMPRLADHVVTGNELVEAGVQFPEDFANAYYQNELNEQDALKPERTIWLATMSGRPARDGVFDSVWCNTPRVK